MDDCGCNSCTLSSISKKTDGEIRTWWNGLTAYERDKVSYYSGTEVWNRILSAVISGSWPIIDEG